MLLLRLHKSYDLDWLSKQFNKRLTYFEIEDFPIADISKGEWIALKTEDAVHAAGQFVEYHKTKYSRFYKIYMTNLIGFKSMKLKMPSNRYWKHVNIILSDVSGIRSIKIDGTYRRLTGNKKIKK